MQVPVYNVGGEIVKNIEISDEVFAVPFNEGLVHQALVRQNADARQGTHDTKTRGEVAGSRKKLYAQKHTGEARAGDRRSPTRRKGGVAFGPHPRQYTQSLPKKMRQLALRCLLSSKVSEGGLKVLDQFGFEAPKTKEMLKVLAALNFADKTLIITAAPEVNVVKSSRNLPGVKTLPANTLNVVDLLSHSAVIMTEDAVRKAEQIWGKKSSQEESSESL